MDASALLSADEASGRVEVVARVALELKQCHPPTECPLYLAALRCALDEEPPPFDTKGYAEVFRSSSAEARWMAISLITNAEREGDGAKRLWSLAACSDDAEEQHLLKCHAVDESRHALFYLALLDLTFPNAASPSFRLELQQLSPGYSMKQQLYAVEGSPYAKAPSIDDFLQMNIAEIRTTIHHIMQRSAIVAHCSAANLRRATSILDSLLNDELRHVAYTAVLIDRIARHFEFDDVANLFCQRLRDFNQITSEELGDRVFDCSVACCAKRPWCRSKASPVPEHGGRSLPVLRKTAVLSASSTASPKQC